MLKRRLPPEPLSVSADWSRRTAAFAALLAVFAVMLGRAGVVGGWGGIAVLAVALSLALVALGFAANAAVVIWQTGRRGTVRALAGCLLSALVLAYPLYLVIEAATLPALNDISTDLVTPPAFSTSASAMGMRNRVVHDEPSEATRHLQRGAYPAVQPVLLDTAPDEVYRLVRKMIAARHWREIEAVAPKGRFGVGHIDAVAFSRIMGFPEDVAIRIRPEEGQTRVDIRSASRIERHDIGANAARIESFAEDLSNGE